MRLVRRILIATAITVAVIALGLWTAPAALSFYSATKAPYVTRVVPTNLRDLSVSQAQGTKLSYVGYEFEVPWTDLDETQTKLLPKENPCKAILTFHSGLRLAVTAVPPREWARNLAEEMKVPPERFQLAFGQSDYDFLKALYEFSPDKMHHWGAYQVHGREQLLLLVKSIALPKSAESGIFRIRNQALKGFEEGDPQARPNSIIAQLFSDEGSVELIFVQKDYRQPSGLTQPELNRIIESVHKIQQKVPSAPGVLRQ